MDIKNFVLSDAELGAVETGAWVGDLAGAPGLRLKVRGMGSKEARKTMERKQAEARAGKKKGKELSNEEVAKCIRETLADAVLLDWDGLTNNGEPLRYDSALARQFITGRNGEAFADLVMAAAKSLDESPAEFIEAAGND